MPDREKVIRGLKRCAKKTCPSFFSKEYAECEYTVSLFCCQDSLLNEAIELLENQEEREKAICKEICEYIRGTCCTDTYEDKEHVCHVIQQYFVHFGEQETAK